jgi:hypothetical protein
MAAANARAYYDRATIFISKKKFFLEETPDACTIKLFTVVIYEFFVIS